jgi:hypothetical protein
MRQESKTSGMTEGKGNFSAKWTAKLDQTSRLRLRAFAFKLVLLVPVSIAFAAQHHYSLFGSLAYFCFWFGVFSGLSACMQRHKFNAVFLTTWDEIAAFLGIGLAGRLIASLAG